MACKEVVLKWLWENGYPFAEENPDRYGIDIIAPWAEVEDAAKWWPNEGRHPMPNIHVPASKEKFFVERDILFVIVNGKKDHLMHCSSAMIRQCPMREIPNALVPSGEYFYVTPNSEWKLVKLKENEMGFERKPNTGSLFNNEKTKETQPDYTGEVNVEGTLYRVAGWNNKGTEGKKDYISLTVKDAADESWKTQQSDSTASSDEVPF